MNSSRTIFLPLLLLPFSLFQTAPALSGGCPIEGVSPINIRSPNDEPERGFPRYIQDSSESAVAMRQGLNQCISGPVIAGNAFSELIDFTSAGFLTAAAAGIAVGLITGIDAASSGLLKSLVLTAFGFGTLTIPATAPAAGRSDIKNVAVAAAQPPVAVDDAYGTLQDTTLIITAPGVLGNDTGPDGSSLSAHLATGVSHGTLAFNPDGSFTYTPGSGFTGQDSFTYTAQDNSGHAAASPAIVTVTVTEANVDPAAEDDNAATDEDTAVDIAVLANDSDADGDALRVTSVTQPAHGEAVIQSDNTVTYTPDANFNGTDSFTYTISDGNGGVATATVTVTVAADNDAPSAK